MLDKLIDPFPFTVAGVNVSVPTGLMFYWLILIVLNVTIWLTIGVFAAAMLVL